MHEDVDVCCINRGPHGTHSWYSDNVMWHCRGRASCQRCYVNSAISRAEERKFICADCLWIEEREAYVNAMMALSRDEYHAIVSPSTKLVSTVSTSRII